MQFDRQHVESLLNGIREQVRVCQVTAAESALTALLERLDPVAILSCRESLEQAVEAFGTHKKRKAKLQQALASAQERAVRGSVTGTPAATVAATGASVVESPPTARAEVVVSAGARVESIQRKRDAERKALAFREQLRTLEERYIFQWKTHYRNVFSDIFDACYKFAMDSGEAYDFIGVVRLDIINHAKAIFDKGYYHHINMNYSENNSSVNEGRQRSFNGLQSFLNIPLEFYVDRVNKISSGAEAFALRRVCSSVMEAIITGYGETDFGGDAGWHQFQARLDRHLVYLPFLTYEDLLSVLERLGSSTLANGVRDTVVPAIEAIDRIMRGRRRDEYVYPQVAQYIREYQRLEVDISPPKNSINIGFLSIHCYLSQNAASQAALGESMISAASLITASLRPDVLEWAISQDALAGRIVDNTHTAGSGHDRMAEQALAILESELSNSATLGCAARPLTYNYANNFPLKAVSVRKFYMVRRNGFKKMVLDTVGRTGVQLWCSVRRSGKTTACFDLGSGGGAQVIVQTMQTLNKDDLSNRFNAQFKNALAERRQISDNFFNDAIAKSIDEPMMQDAKKIFILDEYETLFEQMRAEGNEDDLLRYRVIQPLMNQMIAFSDDNTLVFVGQRPDAYYIYMDQNQLAAYVERRPFPLFEHNAGSIHSEFSALVRKVLTNNASFDSSFVDSVFRETAGHPYLTVNVLKDFYDWLISDGWPSNALDFDGQVFARYVDNCMNTVALGKSLNYEFFKKTLSEYMSIETLRRRPWLYFVTTALKTIAKVSPDTLEADWDAVVADIAAHAGNLADPQELLASAVTSNFLSHEGGRVKPAIPIFGRLAAVCMPNDR